MKGQDAILAIGGAALVGTGIVMAMRKPRVTLFQVGDTAGLSSIAFRYSGLAVPEAYICWGLAEEGADVDEFQNGADLIGGFFAAAGPFFLIAGSMSYNFILEDIDGMTNQGHLSMLEARGYGPGLYDAYVWATTQNSPAEEYFLEGQPLIVKKEAITLIMVV